LWSYNVAISIWLDNATCESKVPRVLATEQ
jgi:hypothetical protein